MSTLQLITDQDRETLIIGLNDSFPYPLTDPIDVTYDGLGGIRGYGGPLAAFTDTIPVS